ncbi:hypothetical protein PF049_02560 [Erythrobacteraceae bacterium WH01K]|nr:hypothetical protein PF049_02560 [Erythrobacteraceae bacterium WH01K]
MPQAKGPPVNGGPSTSLQADETAGITNQKLPFLGAFVLVLILVSAVLLAIGLLLTGLLFILFLAALVAVRFIWLCHDGILSS